MSTVDDHGGEFWIDTKGAPETVLPCCTEILLEDGQRRLDRAQRAAVERRVDDYAGRGLRVLAVARRRLGRASVPELREEAEQGLTFLGLVAMVARRGTRSQPRSSAATGPGSG